MHIDSRFAVSSKLRVSYEGMVSMYSLVRCKDDHYTGNSHLCLGNCSNAAHVTSFPGQNQQCFVFFLCPDVDKQVRPCLLKPLSSRIHFESENGQIIGYLIVEKCKCFLQIET